MSASDCFIIDAPFALPVAAWQARPAESLLDGARKYTLTDNDNICIFLVIVKKVPLKERATANGPSILVVYCQQSVREGTTLQLGTERPVEFSLRTEMIPCSSKLRVSHLLKILEQGIDGLEVVCCPQDKCRFLVGSRRAGKRVEYARKLLAEAGLAPDRLGISEGADLAAADIVALGEKRAKAVRDEKKEVEP